MPYLPPTFRSELGSVPRPRLRWHLPLPGQPWENGQYLAWSSPNWVGAPRMTTLGSTLASWINLPRLAASKNKLLLLDCRSLEWRSLPLPDGIDIIIADTTLRRQLTASAYNDRRRSCEAALAELRLVCRVFAPCVMSASSSSISIPIACLPSMNHAPGMWWKKSAAPNRRFLCWRTGGYASLVN